MYINTFLAIEIVYVVFSGKSIQTMKQYISGKPCSLKITMGDFWKQREGDFFENLGDFLREGSGLRVDTSLETIKKQKKLFSE